LSCSSSRFNFFEAHKKEGYTSVFALLGDGLVKLVAVSSSEAFSFSQDRYASIFETFFLQMTPSQDPKCLANLQAEYDQHFSIVFRGYAKRENLRLMRFLDSIRC